MILFRLSYTTFFIWPLFRGLGRNPYKNLFGFLVDLKTLKGHFEINWPLKKSQMVLNGSWNLRQIMPWLKPLPISVVSKPFTNRWISINVYENHKSAFQILYKELILWIIKSVSCRYYRVFQPKCYTLKSKMAN